MKNMIINDGTVKDKLQEHYKDLHPLLLLRSCEYAYANSAGGLFDILDTIPALPFAWDKKKHCWVFLEDLTQAE